MTLANKDNPECPNCNKSGLAILPVRYAVVPNGVDADLPESLGRSVRKVELKNYKYAMRTLRQGFVYLFYEKHARGSNVKWEVYSVSNAGTLWKQPSPYAIDAVTDDPACARTGHNIPASVISIETPEKCGVVWIAFSEHSWSAQTINAFEKDGTLRARRMQPFAPAEWIKTQAVTDAIAVTEENLNQVIEYKSDFSLRTISDFSEEKISKPDGSFQIRHLERQCTRYPVHIRRTQKATTVEAMTAIGACGDGRKHPPALFALSDCIGITHELNGYRNDAARLLKKYGEERSLELAAYRDINALRIALQDHAAKHAKASAQRQTALRQIAARRQHYTKRSNQAWAASMESKPRDAAAEAWPKYESHINTSALQTFGQNYGKFSHHAKLLIDQRTEDLLAWIESSALLDALTEFSEENLSDGVAFEYCIGEMLFGISSTILGLRRLSAWIAERRVTSTNLVWRAFSLNQALAGNELNAVLKGIEAAKDVPFTEQSLEAATPILKYVAKLSELSKKALTLHNTLRKDGVAPCKTGGMEKILLTIGTGLFDRSMVRKGSEWLSEKLVKSLLLARAGCDYVHISGLLALEARHGLHPRDAALLAMRSAPQIGRHRFDDLGMEEVGGNVGHSENECEPPAGGRLQRGQRTAVRNRSGHSASDIRNEVDA